MTPRTNARLAGVLYLLYFTAGITSMIVFRRATAGAVGTAEKLASIASHQPLMGLIVVLALLMAVCAIGLGVTLHALTREQDRDLAVLGLSCRVVEGASNALSIQRTLWLMSVATTSTSIVAGTDAAAVNALGALMLGGSGGAGGAGAFLFGLGSLCFCYLFVRARTIPSWLAWPGLLSSVLWVIGVPLQLAGFIGGAATYALWIPMGLFELTFAAWLIARGVGAPAGPAGNPVSSRPLR